MRIKVILSGCDDGTVIYIKVNDMELALLRRLEKLSRKASTYVCQPVLHVVGVTEGDTE